MQKKDYVKAAKIVAFERGRFGGDAEQTAKAQIIEDAFVELFRGDNAAFNESRFRAACQPAQKARR